MVLNSKAKNFIWILFLAVLEKNIFAKSPEQTPSMLVRVEKILERNIYKKLELMVECKARQERLFFSTVAGEIDFISENEGEEVKEGEKIISMDSKKAELLLQAAKLNLENSKFKFEANKKLYEKDLLSYEIFFESQIKLSEAKLDYEKTLKNYKNMIIVSPFSGYLNPVQKKIGDQVNQGEVLFHLVNNKNCEGKIFLPDIFSKFKKNDFQVFIYNKEGIKNKAKIISIANKISSNGGVLLKIEIPQNIPVVDGMIIPIEIEYENHIGIIVSEKSIMVDNDGTYLYKLEGEKVKKIYIKTGERKDDRVEIFSDELKKDELIITEGFTKLSDGVAVRVLK